MKATPYPKTNIEVANDFFTDCQDLLIRYDRTIHVFFPLKTRRMKCFGDLRGSYECVLKGALAYVHPMDSDRKGLIRKLENFGHKISSLEDALINGIGNVLKIERKGEILEQLPVGLRYALDGYDFIEAKEDLYYETIGSDNWLAAFRAYVGSACDALGKKLATHSGIVSVSDIPIDMLLNPGFNKYRP